MRVAEVSVLHGYCQWANGRVLDATAQVPAAQLVEPAPVSHGSLLGTLVHVLSCEREWRVLCQEGDWPSAMLTVADFPTLSALRERWAMEAESMRVFIDGFHDEDLDGLVRYTDDEGTAHEDPLWHVLVHVVNHGTQFRSEAAVVLTEAGHSPGSLDLVGYRPSA